MTDTLTQLITRVEAALIDDGTRFTTATCTAAIREALKQFNLFVPVFAGDLITVVANQQEYELTAVDNRALQVLDVLKQATTGEDDESLLYDAYTEDERIFFRLRTAESSGTLIVRYSLPQTISGLDSQTESTLLAYYDQVLINGAAAEALAIRARSRVETINLQQSVSDNYIDQIKSLRTQFQDDLQKIAAQRRPATGKKVTRSWDDKWHNWDQ